MQITDNQTRDRGFLIRLSLLFALALAIRWIRLDLMMFRYDQAEIAGRCMETWRTGLPFTGILNSMGFRNAPGYVWALMPGFIVSADPRWAVAWHGFLSATMIFPLAILGRKIRSDAFAWLPAVLAAFLPVSVFAGRNLWAQFLLPACSAWAILALTMALISGQPAKNRNMYITVALAIMAFACSIHFSAAPLLCIAALFGYFATRDRIQVLGRLVLPALLILLTIVPSVLDYWNIKTNPRFKPDFAEKFDSVLPDPLPWWERLRTAMESLFYNFSVDAVSGVSSLLSGSGRPAVVLDAIVVALLAAGGIGLVARFFNSVREEERDPGLPELLLAWLLIPAVGAALLVPRLNAGYFIGSLPAVWLLPLYLPEATGGKLLKKLIVSGIGLGSIAICIWFLVTISGVRLVPGNFYIPYGTQVKTIEALNSSGVGTGKMKHLSGDWFGRPYAYIHKHVVPGKGERWGLLEDTYLRIAPGRLALIEQSDPHWNGTVAFITFDNNDDANEWAGQYYHIPNR